MLDHEDFLPEEQVHAEFVQELQTIYQMKPEEKEVLARVHERLARHASHLAESVQVGEPARSWQLASRVASASRPVRWQRHFSSLIAVLFVVLLVGALALTFSVVSRSSSVTTGRNTLRLLLVPTENGDVLSQTELTMTRTILSERFSSFGLQGVNVQVTSTNGHAGLLVELPHFGGNEKLTVNTLLEKGVLQFWDTGPTEVNVGATFDPGQYTPYNPGGKPRFTGQDLDPHSLAVTEDQTGQSVIDFSMKGDAIRRFQLYTTNNVGHYLTITLDGKVLESAVIQSAINGQGQITGNFTRQQARAILAALRYGSLPVALKQQG